MAELWKLTATEIQSRIKKGDLTLEEYAKSLLQRIQERDPVVKAWAYLNPEQVLAEARRMDQIPPEKRGPLHGFVIGVKDIILTKDMPTAFNSEVYRNQPPITLDAAPIITLRANGAFLFGKTHTTEFAASSQGPPTRNPHDQTRTPGGSSSGSGAAVGDYQVPISLGTQTLGSVIRPGSYNGAYAFKPTWGAISREGLATYSLTCDTFGMYARCVEDLETLFSVYQIRDDEPVSTTPFSVKGAKIAFCKTHVWPKAGPSLEKAWKKARELLEKEGASVEDLELPAEFAKVSDWHANVLVAEGRSSFLGNYLLDKETKRKMDSKLVDLAENKTKLPNKVLLESLDGCARLRPVFDDIAKKYDAIITPSATDEAPVGTNTGDGSFCLMWTILHMPVINLPGFAGVNDLPIGLSLVGARYTDQDTLRTAKGIGKVFEAGGEFKYKGFW